ncbi:uncharacterized protein EV420DRAFT_1067896 [Desarmillaria tabescens]|uniref:Uncharacterized protein n=1 Tax=Armillaria tabescens TaxID=1929756 RepID=A0AA39JI12_ARMTA|nr:uncharacterized protein EV420DRAFT_1067896 [Desarmillaria tabescens]KAK0443140.1 hypothetical protein EV420DRAFT_1067896 [Desarmillaria tabescens]
MTYSEAIPARDSPGFIPPPPHHPPSIVYTLAHTNSSSIASQINAIADRVASGSQHSKFWPPLAPLPTFFMDSFMLYSENDDYISAPPCPATTMLLPFYDQHTPSEHLYLRASSAYSTLVQLYARLDQLDTAYTRFRRFGNVSPMCISGCDALETVHHVFISCPTYRSFRQQAAQTLITETSRILDSAEVPLLICRAFLHIVQRLFEDGSIWPQSVSRFYLGLTPSLPTPPGLKGEKTNQFGPNTNEEYVQPQPKRMPTP